MPDPITIDNYPRQVDENYAYRQREHDETVAQGLASVGGTAETFAATQASALANIGTPSAVAVLVGTDIKTMVAFVDYDPSVNGVRSRSPFLTPNLGPLQKREDDQRKIEDVINRASTGDRAEIEQAGAAILAGLDQSIQLDKMGEEVRNRMASLRQA
jgi:hypothetical protein